MDLLCDSEKLKNGQFQRIDVTFRGQDCSVIVLRHEGVVRAYRNLCVHMPRALDCENKTVYGADSEYLRCSMHGIVYSPSTGESLSDICRGKKLTAIRVVEQENRIYINDRRVKIVNN